MLSTPTSVQIAKCGRGALSARTVRDLMKALSYYPTEEEAGDQPVTTSVQLPPSVHQQIEFTARLWNALDKARGIDRRYKWKPASVIRRLCAVGTAGVAEGLGGIPESDEDQAALIETTAAKVAASAKKPKQ